MALGYGGTTHMRIDSFLERCEAHGIAINHVLNTENSVAGGYESMKAYIRQHSGFDCLFGASDVMVFGAAKAMHQAGIRVPEDVPVISVGNGNPDYVEYSIPSISSIDVPIEKWLVRF